IRRSLAKPLAVHRRKPTRYRGCAHVARPARARSRTYLGCPPRRTPQVGPSEARKGKHHKETEGGRVERPPLPIHPTVGLRLDRCCEPTHHEIQHEQFCKPPAEPLANPGWRLADEEDAVED